VLMQAKSFAAACPKLEQSQAIQPAGGTLMFLALCREGEGRTATAWVTFNEVLSAARRDHRADREEVAREHLATLTPLLMKLTVEVPDAARVPGLEVRRDGDVVASAVWGTPVPIDPGPHVVRATAPGKLPWESPAEARTPGAVATVRIPELAPGPVAPPAVVEAPADTGASAPGKGQRIAVLAVGGAGVVAIGIGTYFGVTALVKKGDAGGSCTGPAAAACRSSDESTSRTAVSDGNVSSIVLGVGAAAVIGAGVLWLTAPRKATARASAWSPVPLVGAHFAGLEVGRAW